MFNYVALFIAGNFSSAYNPFMDNKWQAKLKQLGIQKGTQHLKSTPPLTPSPLPIETSLSPDDPIPLTQLLPGLHLHSTPQGECLLLDTIYPIEYPHGAGTLGDLLHHPPHTATFHADERLPHLHFQDFVFLDTETTGLAGANTLAFLVGIAFYDDDAFVVRQYFLRDHADEPAMLHSLGELLQEKAGLITFNGRSFDIPLLDSRYLMNRMVAWSDVLPAMPHLDLMHPARRLWYNRLGAYSLQTLEKHLLQIQRSQADIPGYLIPQVYYHYLRHGEGEDLTRVFYHNELDLLSMSTLATLLLRQFNEPTPTDPPLDLLSLAKWHTHLNNHHQAESCYRLALATDLPLDKYMQGLGQLAQLLKRQERREEAIILWQQMAVMSFDDVTAHIELAKHYEWHDGNLTLAQKWAERAMALIPTKPTTALLQSELQHRLERLVRKQNT